MEAISGMNQIQIMKYAGSMQQIAYIRPVEAREGRARGMGMLDVKSGPLTYQIMTDKCLDIAQVSYRGVNFNFMSKPGLQGRNNYDTSATQAGRSIMGGLFFTAGYENVSAPCVADGVPYPLHGRMRTTPAEHVCADAYWQDDNYVIRAAGTMREATLFGENFQLRRSITSVLGADSIQVADEAQNQSFAPQPFMLMYHCNLGWPFLSEHTRFYIPSKSVEPRDDASRGHESACDTMEAPKDNEPEWVFTHRLRADADGNTHVLAVNQDLQMGLRLDFNITNLPYFIQWKSIASGDYVAGLEPANCSVQGRAWHQEHGLLHIVPPFASVRTDLRFTFFAGTDVARFVDEYTAAARNWK